MPYPVLAKLKAEGSLRNCSITVSDNCSIRRHRTIFGRDISGFTRSGIELRGGETGHERISVPMESVREIRAGARVVYRKKKRIVRIYPR
jgi:hypothetical protein